MNKCITSCALSTSILPLYSQSELWTTSDRESVNQNGWFLEAGLDMTLQNPYGYDFGRVFPNGKSFGGDVGVGKWLAPSLGLRSRVNWENSIGLFEDHHLNWLAPYNKPGENIKKGGYISMEADYLMDVYNLC